MVWLFNKTGIMTVLGVLLLILVIYLIRASVSWPLGRGRLCVPTTDNGRAAGFTPVRPTTTRRAQRAT
jgi:hypothetical protein